MTFKPARYVSDAAGLFVSLTGSTNSGKSFSALRLALGIAGSGGKVAVLDTEGGRMLNLRDRFAFDIDVMKPPFRPQAFTDAAKVAEGAGYSCLVIDSFSMEWAGLGGVLDWQAEEFTRMGGNDKVKVASWIKPKMAHKAMVNAFLQCRMPIVFSIRGEETIKIPENGGKPEKIFKPICNKAFPFEMTIAFRLAADKKGYIDLSDPSGWKMEGAHREIFRDGEQLSEDHGARLQAWATSVGGEARGPDPLAAEGALAADHGTEALSAFWGRLTPEQKAKAGGKAALDGWKIVAAEVDAENKEQVG